MRVNLTAERREIDYGHPGMQGLQPVYRVAEQFESTKANSVSGATLEALEALRYALVPLEADGEFIQTSLMSWTHVWTCWDEERKLLISWILTARAILGKNGNIVYLSER